MNSGWKEFDNQPKEEINTEGKRDAGSMSGQLSRSQRHGGNVTQVTGNNDPTGKRPVKDTTSKNESSDWEEKEHRFPTWVRVMFWVLRKSIVPIIMLIMLLIGLYVGYVVLGKGPKGEVFDWATWRHLYDLVFADS